MSAGLLHFVGFVFTGESCWRHYTTISSTIFMPPFYISHILLFFSSFLLSCTFRPTPESVVLHQEMGAFKVKICEYEHELFGFSSHLMENTIFFTRTCFYNLLLWSSADIRHVYCAILLATGSINGVDGRGHMEIGETCIDWVDGTRLLCLISCAICSIRNDSVSNFYRAILY